MKSFLLYLRQHVAILIIVIIAAVVSSIMALRYGIPFSPDTWTYVDAVQSLQNGVPDIWRTPVYPAFIWLCQLIAGIHFEWLVVALQIIVFLLSLPFFNRIAENLCKNEKISLIATVVYAIVFIESGFNQYVLTESLAASFMVFLLYYSILAIERPKMSYALAITLFLVLLVFIRPALIYLLPVYLIFAIVLLCRRNKSLSDDGVSRRKKFALSTLTGVVATSALLAGYALSFKAYHGIFSLSCVNTYNNYYTLRQNGMLDANATDNVALSAEIENSHKENGIAGVGDSLCWEECTRYVGTYSLPTLNEVVNKSISNNKGKWTSQIFDHISDSAFGYAFPRTWVPQLEHRINLISAAYLWIYVAILVFMIIIGINWLKKRAVLPHLLILFIVLESFLVALVGAKDDLDRLVFPSISAITLAFFIIICQIVAFTLKRKSPNTL